MLASRNSPLPARETTMLKEFAYTLAATLLLAVALVAAPALSKGKAPATPPPVQAAP